MREQITRLHEEPVSQKELERVKAQVMANQVYEQDSVFYQAMQIGTLETVGLGWEVRERYLAGIQAVTSEQVQEVARRYLVDDHLTVATLDPLPKDGEAQAKARRRAAAAGVDAHGR